MSDLFCCKDSAGRYVFNIFFVSLIGAVVILFLFLGGYLFYKRYKKAKKRRRLMYRSQANTNNTNTNSTVLSGASTSEQIATSSNFILGRPPATDVVLGVYGDEASRNARTAFYDEKGWRGFAYWKIFYFAQGWEVQSIFLSGHWITDELMPGTQSESKTESVKFCEGMQLYPLQENQYSNKRYLLTQKLACGTQLSRHSYQVASMYSLKLNGPWSRSLNICRFLKEGWPSTLRHLKLSTHGSFLKRYVRRQFQTV